ncbi:lysine--tRNA ligase [symbiont of Argiope bruennichi]|uniref:lysine--tRNA ligase n=1 Tax=symbiont of Argiope bruennichi TaxID=2810479 RepID=UPI003DA47025
MIKEELEQNLKKFKEIKKLNNNCLYNNNFPVNIDVEKIIVKYKDFSKEELLEVTEEFSLYGRIILKRQLGKAIFFSLKNNNFTLQIYLSVDTLKDQNKFLLATYLNLLDIIWVKGKIFRTKVGELSLKASDLVLLSKSNLHLPDKHLGIKNIELKYRKRYLDLIQNNKSFEVFKTRTKIIKLIRNFFDQKEYLEVDTPILQPIYGGALAKPFKTYFNYLGQDIYLRIAPELYLKKLIVAGFSKVYEIGKNFRNEGMSPNHNPEFTTIEVYAANENLDYMIKISEDLINYLFDSLKLPKKFKYNNLDIQISEKFEKMSMVEAILKYKNIDFNKILDFETGKKLAIEHNIEVQPFHNSLGHIISLFFENFVEEKLINPTFITEFPAAISPLARKIEKNPMFTYRFELYIGKKEYANAFFEIIDPLDQLNRFILQKEEKKQGNFEASDIDYTFIDALSYGMCPTAGLGIGVDRLIMLITNSFSIKDIILFPHLKSFEE